jgi:hypothetical protein
MIRKYGISMFAIVIAAAMAAFTIPKNTHLNATHVFEFDGVNNSYTVGNVTSNANWKYVGETSQEPLCDDTPDKACRIAVTDAYVNSTSNPTALSGMAISATTSLSGNAYVTGITDEGANLFTNQEADN